MPVEQFNSIHSILKEGDVCPESFLLATEEKIQKQE